MRCWRCSSSSRRRRSTSTSTRPRPRCAFAIPAAVRGFIVGGLRQALDGGGAASAQAPDAGAMARWQAEPHGAAPAAAMRSLFARDCPRRHRALARPAGSGVATRRTLLDRRRRRPKRPNRSPPRPRSIRSASRAGRWRRPTSSPRPPDGLVIVDQHAAHERLVLERLRAPGAARRRRGEPGAADARSGRTRRAGLRPARGHVPKNLPNWASRSSGSGPAAMLVRAVPAALAKSDVRRPGARPRRRSRAARREPAAGREARARAGDDGLPRLGARRPHAVGAPR